MSDIEKKLQNFEESCYKLANEERNNLEEKVNQKIKDSIEEELNEYKLKLEQKKKNTLKKMEKNFNSSLWEVENECKKRLIKEENKMQEELFSNVCNEMVEYVQRDEYLEFFINSISGAIKSLNSREQLVIGVTQKDKDRFKNEIENFSHDIEIIDDSFIGGCIVKNNSEIINNTILMNLKEIIHEGKNNS